MVVQMNGKLKFKAEQLIDEAYKKGYEEGKKFKDIEHAIDYLQKCGWMPKHDKALTESEYQRGLDEAWETAFKVAFQDEEVRENIFGSKYLSDVKRMGATKVIEIFRERATTEAEESEEKYAIKAGDEILYTDAEEYDTKAVVMDVDQDGALWILDENGCAITIKSSEVKRTGRHFEGVDSLLQQIRN